MTARNSLRFGLLGGTCVAVLGAGIVLAQPPATEPTPSTAISAPEGAAAPVAAVQPTVDAPWASVPTAPTFLDTTDRRVGDGRPDPTAEQLEALNQLEEEYRRFLGAGHVYRDSITSILRREYLRQRRAREQGYAAQISEEERLQNEAREKAIRMFERFVERYPDEATYTPDAMFRLGELYYERAQIRFSVADPSEQTGSPDYTDTIQLYQRLATRFSNYRRIDGVLYLIGYSLNEMGKTEEAKLAWLNLVCANKYHYDPQTFAAEQAAAAEAEANAPNESPALGLPPIAALASATPVAMVDPYAECTGVSTEQRFLSETWMRVGEYHFDFDSDKLEFAVGAYRKITANPEDRLYSLALYKLAWTYYRAYRYPEAVQGFGKLVQWSDEEEQRTGRAGSELRKEAIDYIGIAFAYEDWNENSTKDVEEGLPSPLQRVQDPNLLPQDRPWTPEVYFRLGEILFEEARFADSIAVWKLGLEKFPLHRRAPEVQNLIARAYTRNQEMEAAIVARANLSQYGEGSSWWTANLDNPSELRGAEELSEEALVRTAVHHHESAQELRRQCVQERQPELCTRSQEQYRLASQAYRAYVERYPNNQQAYELQYNLADALYWSEDYEGAAREYAAVRDSSLDDSHLGESARRVVESLKRLSDAATASGALTVRVEPPTPANGAVQPIAMPDLVQRLAQAREVYVARVDERHDTENVRESYDYNNALLLYAYGYWPQARERFARIFEERCSGENADETGRVAWTNLRNMALALGQVDEVERLGGVIQTRRCSFASGAAGQSAPVDCTVEANRNDPMCIVQGDLTAIRYRRALDIFANAERATGDEQRRLYEQSAGLLVQAVNETPGDPQAPIALERAAVALERTNRFESAARLYQRIKDEVGPRTDRDPTKQAELDKILANAYFRIAFNANRFFDYDLAVENYRALADSQRFANSRADLREFRDGALVNAAQILEWQQQYARAADYYRRAVSVLTGDEKTSAAYRLAEMSHKQRRWDDSVRAMQGFIDQYRGTAAAGELVVQASWRIAQARSAQGPVGPYRTALQGVLDAFARSGQQPGSIAAEYAAEAQFRLVDTGVADFERFSISVSSPATPEALIASLNTQKEQGSQRVLELTQGYGRVLGFRRPVWTVAAIVQQGRLYEQLAKALLAAPTPLPTSLARTFRSIPAEQADELRAQFEDGVRQQLDAMAKPVECLGIAQYVKAARAARTGSLDTEFTRVAFERLQAYGEDRIGECIAQVSATDSGLTAATAGEFARAPQGRTRDLQEGIAAPPLAREEARQ